MQKQVIVTIQPDGTTKVDAENFKGVGCKAATEQIELSIAGRDPGNRDDKKKPDYYQSVGNTATLKA